MNILKLNKWDAFFKKLLVFLLSILLVFSNVDLSFALDAGDGVVVDKIKFVREHLGFNTSSAYIEITGTNLQGVVVRFEKAGIGGGLQLMGTKVDDEAGFLKYTFTTDEAQYFTGVLRIGNKDIDINLSSFPTLDSVNKKNINVDNNDDLVLSGTNLDKIKVNAGSLSPLVKANFGRVQSTEFFYDSSTGDSANKITLETPSPPESKGYQNIQFSRDETIVDAVNGNYDTSVKYLYASSFRFVENVGLTGLDMFPNTGAKGDEVYFDADDFNDTKDYSVYFLKALDGSDDYKDTNKASFVSVQKNTVGKDRLIVKVPESIFFELRNYYVVITNTLNGEIIAEQVVKDKDGNDASFTVIGSGYKPSVETVFPTEGPDTGGNVQISGRNILTPNVPDLVKPTNSFSDSYSSGDGNITLDVVYGHGVGAGNRYEYNGKEVLVSRNINVQIGKKVTFVKDTLGNFVVFKGIPDNVQVKTDVIDDALEDPLKDIIVDIKTTLVEATDGVKDPLGKTYVFRQIVNKEDGFKFVPSTITPQIDSVSPEMIQIKTADTSLQNQTQLVIKGSNFLVSRFVNESGDVITKYPSVLIKKNGDNTLFDRYQLGVFPNEKSGSVTGIIKWKADDTSTQENILMNGLNPENVDIKIVDDNNKIVDGTTGNDVGTKIIILLPKSSVMSDTGIKNVQVTNPRRGSDDNGASSILTDSLTFVKTSDIPVIESIIPNIVTVDGGDQIVITGSNFQDGVRVFLDGEEMTGVTRDIDSEGTKVLLKFDAPSGRLGSTQIIVQNLSGGMDTKSFTYVKSFNKDPELYSFAPTLGTEGTLVLLNGDNYLKPDPTAVSTLGYEGLRLIGSRVLLDGKDISTYNYDGSGNIDFKAYTSPLADKAITESAGKAVYSKFYKNASVIGPDSKIFHLDNDKFNNPRITNYKDVYYSIKYENGTYKAYDKDDVYIANVTITDSLGTNTNYQIDGITLLTVNKAIPEVFSINMDNKTVRISYDDDGKKNIDSADYNDSIILTDGSSFYTLTKDLKGDIKLSNGKDIIYTIMYDNVNNKFVAYTEGTLLDVTLTDSVFTVGLLNLTYITPYVFDSITKEITGNRKKVITKDQIMFYVPKLFTGKGYKDLVVMNPDTKTAKKLSEDGFYYVSQSSSHPAITDIYPDRGSIDGGYNIKISGNDFEDNAKVYIDSQLVPKEDTFVSIDGSYIVVKVPKTLKDLKKDYDVDRFTVPILVINDDGGNAYKKDGFTYIIPVSSPRIDSVVSTAGSSNGGEIVEISGYEFRYYEPYTDSVGGNGYDIGDKFEDLYKNGVFDDLMSSSVDPNAVSKVIDPSVKIFGYYYDSPILPKVFFGENEAKVVEYSKGYLKVISPPHKEGDVDLYVVNNDLGITNKIKYKYTASKPQIVSIVPNKGKKSGQEKKEIYGGSLYKAVINGYYNDNDTAIVAIPDVETISRFGKIGNDDYEVSDINYGQINNQIASVSLSGGLKAEYRGETNQLILTVEENSKIYRRTFNNYNDTEVYLPLEMLKSGSEYYVPNGFRDADGSSYKNYVYEYVKIKIDGRRMIVQRGYSPKSEYDNTGHVTVTTPSYYTIGSVKLTYTNPDGGNVDGTFTYTNPDSEPKIFKVKPEKLSPDKKYYMIEGSIQGGIEIEIQGFDFRKDVKAYIGNKEANIVEVTTKVIDGVTYDVIIAKVPTASTIDEDQKFPIVIENTDSGLANSSTLGNLIGPNYEDKTIPFYFVYRKPLSIPKIVTVYPEETSVAGGNQITITGSDFRSGAIVIIGSKGGVPVSDLSIEERGSIIKFKLPTGLTLGEKTIQVLNTDFGIASKEKGLKIISNPTVENQFLTEDGSEIINRISIEGGEKIRIQGSEFYENPKVIFGGTRSIKTDDLSTGESGLYVDDKNYIIENGTLATNVEYIDKKTLLVTTPEHILEGDVFVTVINQDKGISNTSAEIKYSEPIPSDPTGLKARIVEDRYVELYDYTAANSEYYEIYYYLGNKNNSALAYNGYRDFKLIDVTERNTFKITSIPGYEKRRKYDKLWFVIKAVNKYGPSNWSNTAYISYITLDDIESISPKDEDGDIGVPLDKDYKKIVNNKSVEVDLNPKKRDDIFISLTEYPIDKYPTRDILVPYERVVSDNSLITVDYGDSKMQFMPINLNTTEFRQIVSDTSGYGKITNSLIASYYSQMAKGTIPRGYKIASKVYQLNFAALNDGDVKLLNSVNGSVFLELTYTDLAVMPSEKSKLALFNFDSNNDNWTKVNSNIDEINNKVTAKIDKPGMYILLISRR
ncbi:IPT/TIG domain-containing protein [Helicovermis profundi]|uniref:IPT/TIG domain-containing protein n=1 Tax=Helicovermis profundi TaxID=3065157 RepID=A0AAU9E084_9FIRM|nr:hypothetical protein HLPR_00900 [Clostridia bacterium S502]